MGSTVARDPCGNVHRPVVRHLQDGHLLVKPAHATDHLGLGLAPRAIWRPSDALHGGRFAGCNDEFVVEGQGALDAGIYLDDHPEAHANIARSPALARAPKELVWRAAPRPGVVLAPPLDVGVAREVRPVDLGLGIGGERVGNQISHCGVEDQDGRIGTHQEVHVLAVRLEGRFGPDNNSQDDGGLAMGQHSPRMINLGFRLTFACHIVMEVAVITAKI